jgi:hypothetical protein
VFTACLLSEMPWVQFMAPFTFVPGTLRAISIAYKPGMVLLVTTECAEAAIAKGRAVRTIKPRTDDDGSGRSALQGQVPGSPEG